MRHFLRPAAPAPVAGLPGRVPPAARARPLVARAGALQCGPAGGLGARARAVPVACRSGGTGRRAAGSPRARRSPIGRSPPSPALRREGWTISARCAKTDPAAIARRDSAPRAGWQDSGPSPSHAIGRAPVYLTSFRSATAADPSNTVPGDCRSGNPRFLAIVNIKRISYADAGFDMYSLVIFAREDSIAKEPEPIRAFLRASVKGLKHAFAKENWEEGAKILLKYNPEVDYDAALGAATPEWVFPAFHGSVAAADSFP